MPLSIIVYFCRIFSTVRALRFFSRSTLVDRRVYFRLLLSTLHAAVSYFLGTANMEKSRLLVTWLLWHYLTIKKVISAKMSRMYYINDRYDSVRFNKES